MDQLRVWRIDEDVQRDPAIAVGKLMAGHLADLNAMEIDRRLIADLQQPVGDQVISLAIDKAFPGRWRLKSGKGASIGRTLSRQYA
jgi:hypothetical protein